MDGARTKHQPLRASTLILLLTSFGREHEPMATPWDVGSIRPPPGRGFRILPGEEIDGSPGFDYITCFPVATPEEEIHQLHESGFRSREDAYRTRRTGTGLSRGEW
jgi:hypothetical protein